VGGVDSGIATESGNRSFGRGFCEANAPALKTASCAGLGVCEGAVLGRGVIVGVAMVSLRCSAGSGLLTGRNVAAMLMGWGVCERVKGREV